ncbi:MAG: hypothetical protein ABIS50_07605 [Luteolibacter sp.]|uniref:hypothetical protein n=1 Tax=Luteolibacter sp. TaxID=1962973 RepID=UPI0032667757
MKTTQTSALLALAAFLAMLTASCTDGTQSDMRRNGNPSKQQSPDHSLGRDHQ